MFPFFKKAIKVNTISFFIFSTLEKWQLTNLVHLGPVVQSPISVNPGLTWISTQPGPWSYCKKSEKHCLPSCLVTRPLSHSIRAVNNINIVSASIDLESHQKKNREWSLKLIKENSNYGEFLLIYNLSDRCYTETLFCEYNFRIQWRNNLGILAQFCYKSKNL